MRDFLERPAIARPELRVTDAGRRALAGAPSNAVEVYDEAAN
jgi:hypothetical protein